MEELIKEFVLRMQNLIRETVTNEVSQALKVVEEIIEPEELGKISKSELISSVTTEVSNRIREDFMTEVEEKIDDSIDTALDELTVDVSSEATIRR